MELEVKDEGLGSWEEVMLVYGAAMKQIYTKLQILDEEFQHVHRYNPIEHIEMRLKSAESIVKKLKRHDRESTLENMVKYVNDIAGTRIVCDYTSDIYKIAEMISAQKDITVLYTKDYIKNPKSSGYMSYHMIVKIPVYLSDRIVEAKVEIQIRTMAMDFWASLEHKIQYKFPRVIPDHIKVQLKESAEIVAKLDNLMEDLNDEVTSLTEMPS